MALYRKYRPATFAEVVGQRHVTDPLSAALESRGADGAPDRINHAYLFSGPRGCGKTSSARILARSLNCVEGPTATPCGKCASCMALGPGGPGNLDVVELDAASHNSVDDMRDLRDKAMYAPAESRYRIFVIDEAHMVTPQGFNALLKIVEEPPEHLIFIFATTEPEKVLTTIRSRTHHYPFRLLPPNLMRGLLERIVGEEHVPVADDVYPLVVRAGGGSPRDSLSVMDQLLAGAGPEGVSYDLAAGLLGVTDQSLLDDAMRALAETDRAALFGCVDRVVRSGQDPKRFAEDLLGRVRDLLVIAAVPNAMEEGLVDAPEDRVDAMREQATAVPTGTLTRFADVLQRGLPDMSGATSPRLLLEVLCARMLLPASEQSVESLIQRIEALERGGVVAGGGAAAGGAGAAARPTQSTQQPGQPPAGQSPAGQALTAAPRQSAPAANIPDDANLSPLQRARLARQPKPQQQPAQPAQPTQPAEPTPAPQQSQQPAQPSVPQPTQPAEPTPAPQQSQQPPQPETGQQSGAPEVSDQEEQARKAREMREISRRMQEQAREHERAERERIAKEREAATRAAEGEDGAVPVERPEQQAQQEQTGQTPPSQTSQPQAEQPAPQPAAEADEPETEASGSDVLGELRSGWQQVVEYAGESNIPVRVMAAQAVPISLEAGVLTIGHHTGALANRLNDPANAAALGAAVQRVQGIEVEVRCVVGTSPRGGADRSGARPRQHQAPAAEGSEDAKPTAEKSDNADGQSRPTIGPADDDVLPAGMAGGHSAPDAEAPITEMPKEEAERRVEQREDAQQQAREDAERSAGGDSKQSVPPQAPPADSGKPVPAYRRILEERRRAMEAAQNAAAGNGAAGAPGAGSAADAGSPSAAGGREGAAGNGAAGATSGLANARNTVVTQAQSQSEDAGKRKYVPPPPAAGTQGVRRRRHDDIPPPPEPYDDVPPPPEPDYGGYPDDGGYGGYGSQPAQPAQGGQGAQGRQPSQPAEHSQAPQQVAPGQQTPQASAAPTSQQAPQSPQSPQSAQAPADSAPDDGLDDDERELLDAALTPGQLDHRDQKEVVMELLAKELGAKPL
ncbi:DNA polymerase III subunit gamma and tau [Corynebacterium xerosis]|uniref:DNA polymerase III subunit gamma and tau n=1 Tax=Corynebacterium xerosis TaxID=1725 RepID=UPI000A5AAEA4|nr:DNA polymerase III subunit gamma and tau [Corynebacterium xerosis]SQB95419.1 DNA polymerase III subunit gamma/tau [Clostridium paraputrificum]